MNCGSPRLCPQFRPRCPTSGPFPSTTTLKPAFSRDFGKGSFAAKLHYSHRFCAISLLQASQSMSITSLPLELVYEVYSYLQLSELQALRLTDRKLYQQSLDTFSDRYFKSFRFLATSEGLRNLEEIAKVRFVRERVQELQIILAIFEGTNRNKKRISDYAILSKSCERFRGVKFRVRYAKYQTIVKDNRNFILSETFNTRLRKCIICFKKLDTIRLAYYTTPFLLNL